LSAADMLNIQLKILGDPQFIKQDDVFYSPMLIQSSLLGDPRLTPNGSLRTDYGEIYIKLTFRTPVDLDESTGLMQVGTNYRTSVFSGIYRVLTVQSELAGGQFIQTLNCIRLPNQPDYDYVNKPIPSTGQRSTDSGILNPINNVTEVGTPETSQYISEAVGQRSAQSLANQAVAAADPLISTAQQKLMNVNKTTVATAISQATESASVVNASLSRLL
jgi:hypothetical protein